MGLFYLYLYWPNDVSYVCLERKWKTLLIAMSLTGTVLLITGAHTSARRVRFKGRLFHVQTKMAIWLGEPPPPRLVTLSFALPLRYFKFPLAIQGSADKSFARPGRKQATATKLGIYSTYSPRTSIHFLARCSNFCKPLKKKKNQKVVRPTRSPRQQWPPRRTKNGDLSIVFSVQGTGGWSRHWKPR